MVNLDESTRSWRVGRRKKRDREKMDLPRGNLLNDYLKDSMIRSGVSFTFLRFLTIFVETLCEEFFVFFYPARFRKL